MALTNRNGPRSPTSRERRYRARPAIEARKRLCGQSDSDWYLIGPIQIADPGDKDARARTVWILGAGFSKALGGR